jgi:hypothetical protein
MRSFLGGSRNAVPLGRNIVVKFVLIISHGDSFAPTETLVSEIVAWEAEMDRRGIRESGNPLRPPAEAVTVRVREGSVSLTPGPFTDSAEQMAAYELLDCASLEEAVDLATSHPMAAAGTIEVRPVWEDLAG